MNDVNMDTTHPNGESILVFRLRDSWFALETALFQAITDISSVHTIPTKTNKCFRGIVSCEGRLLLFFSLADLLGIKETAESRAKEEKHFRLAIFGEGKDQLSFAVDEILGIRKIPDEMVLEEGNHGFQTACIEGKNVTLLNGKRLLVALKRGIA